MHGPTTTERKLMEDWIELLVAFVNNDQTYDFGTNAIDEMKVASPEGKIETRKDERWDSLVKLGEVFANDV